MYITPLKYTHLTKCPAHKEAWACILVQVAIYRRLRIGRDGHLDQSEAYDYRNLYENTGRISDVGQMLSHRRMPVNTNICITFEQS